MFRDLVAALTSKKYIKLPIKKKLLKTFIPKNILDASSYFHSEVYKNEVKPILNSLKNTSKTESQILSVWKTDFVAHKLALIYILNQTDKEKKSNSGINRQRRSRSSITGPVLTNIIRTLKPALSKYREDQANEKLKIARTGLDKQTKGTRVQDTLSFDPLNTDPEPCPNPSCAHSYCMLVNTDQEVENINMEVEFDYARRMNRWNSMPVNERPGKPRKGKSTDRQVACHCVKFFCGLREGGGSCPSCQAAGGATLFTDQNGQRQCSCPVCMCDCQIKFGLSDRRKIALQFEMEKKPENLPKDSRSYFQSVILDTITEASLLSKMDGAGGDKHQVAANSAALTANLIMSNTALQTNNRLRNAMQTALPKTRMTSTGYDIQSLRKRQKMGLSLRNVLDPDVPTVTPASAHSTASAVAVTGAARDQRFYRNKLSPLALSPVLKQHAENICDDDSSVEVLDIKPSARPTVANATTPLIVRRARKRTNKMMFDHFRKEDSDLKQKNIKTLKKVQAKLRSPDKTTINALVDNKECFKDSQEAVQFVQCTMLD